MTEEVKNEQVEQPEITSIEQRAIEMGWRPKEEFNGDEDDFIDAKEFVRRQPLFDKISKQSEQLRRVHESLNQFKLHYNQVEQSAYERAIRDLKAQQKDAIKEGDLERYHELQEDIDAQKEQVQALKEVQPEPVSTGETHPEFQAWTNRNPWYTSTAYMKAYADEVGVRLARQGVAPAEVLKQVEKAVREEFPSKFRNSNKDTAPQLESSGKGSSRSGSGKEYSLTEQERKIMNTLCVPGGLTKEQYIADLRKIKGE